ncbi:MAG: hypothetical protein CM15mP92_1640 [Halieaceae bacterium]|nr:MAG: hypothetical protein CM15mP92_1640 [Halieaceae bacterium]
MPPGTSPRRRVSRSADKQKLAGLPLFVSHRVKIRQKPLLASAISKMGRCPPVAPRPHRSGRTDSGIAPRRVTVGHQVCATARDLSRAIQGQDMSVGIQ